MPLVTIDLSQQEFTELEQKRTALGKVSVGEVLKEAVLAFNPQPGAATIAQPSGAPTPQGTAPTTSGTATAPAPGAATTAPSPGAINQPSSGTLTAGQPAAGTTTAPASPSAPAAGGAAEPAQPAQPTQHG